MVGDALVFCSALLWARGDAGFVMNPGDGDGLAGMNIVALPIPRKLDQG